MNKIVIFFVTIMILFNGCGKKKPIIKKTEKTKKIEKNKKSFEIIDINNTPNANLFQVKNDTILILTYENFQKKYNFYDLNSKKLINNINIENNDSYLNALLIDEKVFGYNKNKNEIIFINIKNNKILKKITSKNQIGFDKRFENENFFIVIEISNYKTKLHLYEKKTLTKISSIDLKKDDYLYNQFVNISYPSFGGDEMFFKFFVNDSHYCIDLKTKNLLSLPSIPYRNFLNGQTEGFINSNTIFYSIHVINSPLDFAIYNLNTSEVKTYNMDFNTYIFGGFIDKNSFWLVSAISQRLDRISIFNTKNGKDEEIILLKSNETKDKEIETYSPNIYPKFTKDNRFLIFMWKERYLDLYKTDGDYTKQHYENYITIYDRKKRKILFNKKIETNLTIHSITSTKDSFLLLQSYNDTLGKPIKYLIKSIWLRIN